MKTEKDIQLRVRISEELYDYLKFGHKQWMDNHHIEVSFNSYVEHLFQEGLISDGTLPSAQFEARTI